MSNTAREVSARLTWSRFLVRWEQLVADSDATEEEFAGALYEGAEIPYSPSVTTGEFPVGTVESAKFAVELRARSAFFLGAARGEQITNEHVQRVAAQRLCAKVLAYAQRPRTPVEVHGALLEFLATPSTHALGLLRPPYPQFLQRYLLQVFQWWAHYSPSLSDSEWVNAQGAILHDDLQKHGTVLVRAMIAWGLAHELPKSPHRSVVVQELLAHLNDVDTPLAGLLAEHCVTLPPLHDFTRTPSGRGGVRESLIRAALALMVLDESL